MFILSNLWPRIWHTVFRVLLLAMILGLSGCSERAPVPFNNVDITGGEIGKSGSSLAGLKDHHGMPTVLADFKGKVVLVYFGYTFCPDICPTSLARFAEVMKLLGNDAGRVQVLFVTLDPERDTPEKLAGYVTWFNPSFIGLYGDAAATAAAAREFKVFYARSKGSEGMGYSIDHSTGAYAFDPAGRIRLYVRDGASVDAIAGDLRRLLAEK